VVFRSLLLAAGSVPAACQCFLSFEIGNLEMSAVRWNYGGGLLSDLRLAIVLAMVSTMLVVVWRMMGGRMSFVPFQKGRSAVVLACTSPQRLTELSVSK